MTTVLLAGGGTGGHLMPALALTDELAKRHPGWRLMLVGARRGVEARLLPDRGYPYRLLSAEPIYRERPWRNLRWPFVAGRLWREVGSLLDAEQPSLVVGTGGYASGPVVFRAARRGIPTAIFEADAVPGLTSRWLSRVVREVYLAVPEAASALSARAGQVVVTGAPIHPPEPALREAALARFGLDSARPVVLVTGGSQGALAINEAVAAWIQTRPADKAQIIWATGPGSFDRFRHLHKPPAVHVTPFLDPIRDAYAVANIAVARAGSLSLAELSAWGIPSLLIPLPTAAADHQTRNAEAAVGGGAAMMLPQSELSGASLSAPLLDLLEDPARMAAMRAAALDRARPEATGQIATRLEGLIAGR